ncbi:hypothetical protein F5Y05DRAFT_420937 [Hypoxylon sp. FL0543]|nr:hypothetical protein F5Y05DRAFT_420937 [Hypoxylon sp. FL0543]
MALPFMFGASSILQTLVGIRPIREGILRHLNTEDLLNLARTASTIRHSIIDNGWDINDKLSRFIKYPIQFRSQLGRSGALISGSFALQFFERTLWPDSDLDIVVQDGVNLEGLSKYLTTVERYKMVEEEPHEYNPSVYIKEVQTYRYMKTGDADLDGSKDAKSKIQLTVTHCIPLLAILRTYYTTALINFISWNKAYSLFPRATFIYHETMPLKPVNEHYGRLHSKYSKRGWRMRTQPITYDVFPGRQSPFGRKANRRVGDKDTRIIRLDTTFVERPSRPDFVLEYSGFQNAVRKNLASRISAELFKSPSLRYQYVYPASGPSSIFWAEISKFLSRNTYGQLAKMSPEDLVNAVGGLSPQDACPYALEFKHPEGWDYYDDLVPELYDHMEDKGVFEIAHYKLRAFSATAEHKAFHTK